MNGETAIGLLILRLGNRKNADIAERINLEMSLSQETLCEELHLYPWFLRYTNTVVPFIAGESKILLPDNFIAFDDDWGGLFVLDPTLTSPVKYRKLRRITSDDYWNKYAYDEVGIPTHYMIDVSTGTGVGMGTEITLTPTPDIDYACKIQYIGKDIATPASNTENRWLKYAPDLLIAHAGYQLASKHFMDDTRAISFSKDIVVATERLVITDTARKETETRTMGEPE